MSLPQPLVEAAAPHRTLPGIARNRAFLNGRWVEAADGRTIEVFDPATGLSIGCVPALGAEDAEQAILGAASAQPAWAARTALERAGFIRRWAELIGDAKEDLATIMTMEQGKPLAEARGEIDYARSFLDWFAEDGQRQYGDVIPSHLPGRRLFTTQVPIGVVAAITPWNFPCAMVTRKAGAALMAGCAMVLRPACETPFSALALAVLAEEAGLPAGLFSVLTGDPLPITQALTTSTVVRKISFTGSTPVGRLLMEQSASTIKKLSMELGGHAPFIVFEDASLHDTVKAAIDAKFQTSGQDCLAANRILVQRPLYDAFCAQFSAAARSLKVGNGFERDVDIGPLIGTAAIDKCLEQVINATSEGARLLAGGSIHPAGPTFFKPTVLADVTPTMRIFNEETFGPIAAIIPFDDEDDCVHLANANEYGLAAYCFGRDLERLWRVADRLEFGMVAINSVKMTGAPIPFGGIKQSGLGREGSRHGIGEYSEIKYLCIGQGAGA